MSSADDLYELILQPGFSTAKEVTDISGRGVGMDVVKRNVEQLRGKIEIQSTKGKGSAFSIRLPLTLAIIDGMLTACGPERYIIPTLAVVESIQPRSEMLATHQGTFELLQLRGELELLGEAQLQ